jgi:hypothetical protein
MRRWLHEHGAATDPSSPDTALLGRTYAIPFDRVWEAALGLASRRQWKVIEADDREGRIVAEARNIWFRADDDVRIRVRLDANAQTRIDMESTTRNRAGDLGVNRRRVRRFMKRLDGRVGATPTLILDGTMSEEITAASVARGS